jgi:hypothetical protein
MGVMKRIQNIYTGNVSGCTLAATHDDTADEVSSMDLGASFEVLEGIDSQLAEDIKSTIE